MNIRNILFIVVGVCVLLSGVMVVAQIMGEDEKTNTEEISTNGNKTNANNSSSVIGSSGASYSEENNNAIISGGQALIDSGLVKNDDNLFTDAFMLNMSNTVIEKLKDAYGENYELAGDSEAIYSYLAPYFDIPTNQLVELSSSLAKNSNRIETRLSSSHTVHAVKQIDDNSFAVYFYVKGDYTDEKGNLIESIDTPYHIMTLVKNKKDVFKVKYISVSKESYILYDEK